MNHVDPFLGIFGIKQKDKPSLRAIEASQVSPINKDRDWIIRHIAIAQASQGENTTGSALSKIDI